MKKITGTGITAAAGIVLLLLCSCGSKNSGAKNEAIDAAHNSRNSLNWAGVYKGQIPAADAPGIDVVFTLNEDGTYEVIYHYVDRGDNSFIFAGNFEWDDAGRVIILDSGELPPYYTVGENMLIQMDMSGQEITGELAENYVLRKSN